MKLLFLRLTKLNSYTIIHNIKQQCLFQSNEILFSSFNMYSNYYLQA